VLVWGGVSGGEGFSVLSGSVVVLTDNRVPRREEHKRVGICDVGGRGGETDFFGKKRREERKKGLSGCG